MQAKANIRVTKINLLNEFKLLFVFLNNIVLHSFFKQLKIFYKEK